MKQLREIQETFRHYLEETGDTINQHIAGPTNDFVERRLYLYKDAYYLRLSDTLEKTYPGVHALLGAEDFYDLAIYYIEKKPSTHFSINTFGKHIPKFLKQTTPYLNRPELTEMATFEDALNKAIHQLNAPVLSQTAFTTFPQERWPELKIILHPSVQILKLSYNIPDVWLAVAEKRPLPEIQKGKPKYWLVWQKEVQTYYIALSPQEAFTLKAFQNNRCIAQICEGLCRWVNETEVPTYLVGLILRWLNDQLLSQFNLETAV
jgi:hypothetical protein